eukprot:1397463-Amphidinium_carterae.1
MLVCIGSHKSPQPPAERYLHWNYAATCGSHSSSTGQGVKIQSPELFRRDCGIDWETLGRVVRFTSDALSTEPPSQA